MDNQLLKKYLKYASTEKSFAILFTKKHLLEVNGYWIDIISCKRYEMSDDNLHFRFVKGGLYKRKLKPKYPTKTDFKVNGKFDENKYYLMVRAITWATACTDIEQ